MTLGYHSVKVRMAAMISEMVSAEIDVVMLKRLKKPFNDSFTTAGPVFL